MYEIDEVIAKKNILRNLLQIQRGQIKKNTVYCGANLLWMQLVVPGQLFRFNLPQIFKLAVLDSVL